MSLTPDPDWWRGAVIYQIYPRSYQDKNGDGIGDLAGIIDRLEYVAGLGVDAIWISPFFPSPMKDFGYDVTDYRGVDPMFGTLADFEALTARAHALGLRVMIDLVLSHTSDQHPWFDESRSSRDNAKADWYVWADPKPDGTPPNNWLSIFGGSAWAWDGVRMQYYLHNFLKEQPDLNFHSRDVQDALLEVVGFWLDKGVDGFRLDTVNFYVHDQELRDNPALRPEDRNATTAPAVNPYNFQEHLFSKNRPENLVFLERLRAVLDTWPDITTLGEVGESHHAMQVMADYTSGTNRLHMCYAFDLLGPEPLGGGRAGGVLAETEAKLPEGWPCYALSNHDTVRMPTRFGLDTRGVKLHMAFLFSVKGSVCLYQGEELGLTEAYVPFEALQDPYGKAFWPKFKGRDGARTPMPWVAQSPYGGFSDATPWLPMPSEHLASAVDRQEGEEDSLLHWTRALIALRAGRPCLRKGTLTMVDAGGAVAFLRRLEGHPPVFCAFNFSDSPVRVSLPEGTWTEIGDLGFQAVLEDGHVTLPSGDAVLAEG